MAETELNEAAKAELEAQRQLTQKSREEYAERTKGKPTPTQEENDRAAMGEHVVEKEADGAAPDPGGTVSAVARVKAMEGARPGTYQTRQAQPARPATPPRSS